MRIRRRHNLVLILFVGALCATPFNVYAGDDDANLQWAPNSEQDLAGYNVYHGTKSGVYGFPENVGNSTHHEMKSLERGKDHYFAVTAYDQSGNESAPSAEVSKAVPNSTTMQQLSVSVTGNGTVSSVPTGISCSNGACSANFPDGTSVTLSASPQSGSLFNGWNGACTGAEPCTVKMTQAQSLTAEFAVAPVTPDQPASAKINFQPSYSSIPDGYEGDNGVVYSAERGYGWDRTVSTRERKTHSDQSLDTFIHFDNASTATWNYDLPNGDYLITLAAGDPSWWQGPHNIEVEGETVIDNVSTKQNQFLTVTDHKATIQDGQLTIRLTRNDKTKTLLNYVDITPVDGPGPKTAPAVAVNQETYAAGDTITVTVGHGQGGVQEWIGLYEASGADPNWSFQSNWQYLNGTQSPPSVAPSSYPVIRTFTAPSTPGTYNIRYFAENGAGTRLAISRNFTIETKTAPAVAVNQETYAAGDTITVTVGHGQGGVQEWIGLYEASGADPNWSFQSNWQYLNGTQSPPSVAPSSYPVIRTFTAPSTPGTYNIRYFAENGAGTRLAISRNFTIGTKTAPAVAVNQETYAAGDTITVTVGHGQGGVQEWIALYEASGADSSWSFQNNWQYLNGTQAPPSVAPSSYPVIRTFTAPSTPGTYNIRYFAENGAGTRLAISRNFTIGTKTAPAVAVNQETYAAGDTITVTVGHGQGGVQEWIALYEASGADSSWSFQNNWQYLNGTQAPPSVAPSSYPVIRTFTAPSTPGTYNIRYFAENGAGTRLAISRNFTIGTKTASEITLTVSLTGDGSISSTPSGLNCTGNPCNANFLKDTDVTLKATPSKGSTFSGWDGACTGTDSCTVNLSTAQSVKAVFSSDSSPSPAVSVNFQPGYSATPQGFLKDTGVVFNVDRGYGWNRSVSTRQRNTHPDQSLDTFIHFDNASEATWTYNLPNGNYKISLATGDPSWEQGPHNISVEGQPVINGVSTKRNEFLTITDFPVSVNDGALTVRLTRNGRPRTLLNYIEITPMN